MDGATPSSRAASWWPTALLMRCLRSRTHFGEPRVPNYSSPASGKLGPSAPPGFTKDRDRHPKPRRNPLLSIRSRGAFPWNSTPTVYLPVRISNHHHCELSLANLLLIHGAKLPCTGQHWPLLGSEKILAKQGVQTRTCTELHSADQTRNAQVIGSSPIAGSRFPRVRKGSAIPRQRFASRCRSPAPPEGRSAT